MELKPFFNFVTVQTPESVGLEFTLAGIGNRALALAIDYCCWGLLITLVNFSWFLVTTDLYLVKGLGDPKALQPWIIGVVIAVNFAIYVGYFVFFETLWQGQTPGKRLMHLRVIRDDGRRVGVTQATLRSLLRPVDDALFFIGAWLIILHPREKRLGDWVAGTLVIQEETGRPRGRLRFSPQSSAVSSQLRTIGQWQNFQPEEFLTLQEYLYRRSQLTPEAHSRVSLQLARQVRERLEVPPSPSDPDLFLEGVYLAYQDLSCQGYL